MTALVPPILLLRALPFPLRLVNKNVLSHRTERGTSGGAIVAAIEALLRSEAEHIARGAELRLGSSCPFATCKTSGDS